jgi:hypothetical protein
MVEMSGSGSRSRELQFPAGQFPAGCSLVNSPKQQANYA